MLLELLNKVAVCLYSSRKALLLLAVLAFASGLYAAMANEARDLESWHLRLSFILALWALMLYVYAILFRTLPPTESPRTGFKQRLLHSIRLRSRQALAIFVVALTLLLLQMSLKLLTV